MKKLLSIVAAITCVFMLFGLTACENKSTSTGGEIEQIGDYAATIYRYKVSKIQLIDADSESEKVLETTNKNKIVYYYSNSELLDVYIDFETTGVYSSSDVSQLANFFNDVTIKEFKEENGYGYSYTYRDYSIKYSAYVKMRVVLDGYDAAYRPECSINGDLMNITVYSFCTKDGEELSSYYFPKFSRLASKEVSYEEYKKDTAEYNKNMFNAEKESEREDLKTARDEKYTDYTVILVKTKGAISWSGFDEWILYAE